MTTGTGRAMVATGSERSIASGSPPGWQYSRVVIRPAGALTADAVETGNQTALAALSVAAGQLNRLVMSNTGKIASATSQAPGVFSRRRGMTRRNSRKRTTIPAAGRKINWRLLGMVPVAVKTAIMKSAAGACLI